MTTTNFASWLENQFLDWQKQQRKRRTAGEFAEWLGFENMTVNRWLNGKRRPTRGNAQALALKLGLEVYDVLGHADIRTTMRYRKKGAVQVVQSLRAFPIDNILNGRQKTFVTPTD